MSNDLDILVMDNDKMTIDDLVDLVEVPSERKCVRLGLLSRFTDFDVTKTLSNAGGTLRECVEYYREQAPRTVLSISVTGATVELVLRVRDVVENLLSAIGYYTYWSEDARLQLLYKNTVYAISKRSVNSKNEANIVLTNEYKMLSDKTTGTLTLEVLGVRDGIATTILYDRRLNIIGFVQMNV